DNKNYLKEIKNEDRINLIKLKNNFCSYATDELIKYTYINFPFYAINSQVAKDKLSSEDYIRVLITKPKISGKKLYTIGYEGISVEEYFIKLIINDIKVLCDVRNYPRSMKYGFSKNQLKNACDNLGIFYVHLPELGIIPDKRQALETQSDYNNLFSEYKSTTLKENTNDQSHILSLIEKYDRVALTCFESNIHQCHRVPLSKAIESLSNNSIGLLNI
ncbi:MAG: DUF488 domain-containing protein, partial [Bacteroidetes bacterium]|nr:DUF488 domain-containing protein [Bacteroidota bacterium]MBU1678161.1 DUF488 domain-containing protein [Bacteroidota bacterium]